MFLCGWCEDRLEGMCRCMRRSHEGKNHKGGLDETWQDVLDEHEDGVDYDKKIDVRRLFLIPSWFEKILSNLERQRDRPK